MALRLRMESIMNKGLWLVVLLAGLAVLIVGINSSESFASETSELVSGSPTDKALWMMIGGGAVALLGLVGLIGSSRMRRVS